MTNITATLDGVSLQDFTIPFLETPLENAADIVTLNGKIYSDFVNQRRQWEINWRRLHEDDYNDLRAIYNDQFTNAVYPTFVCSYYSINTPVRMLINDKDIQQDGCWIMNVQLKLIQESGF